MRKWIWAALLALPSLVACNEKQKEETGQTVTTAADHAVDAGAQELKREWRNLDVKVESGKTPPTLAAPDAGVTLMPRP